MRKLIVCNIVTVDGYGAGPGDDVMAMPFDEGFDVYNAERLRAADTLLLGRTTFEGFLEYWPSRCDDPGVPPVEREISRLNNAIEKVVLSDTLTADRTGPWTKTEIVRRADAHHRVAELKREPGRDIVVFGSHLMWNGLLDAGLVTELHLMVGPALLGGGVRAFEGHSRTGLRLIDAAPLPGSRLVLVRYGVTE
ncbi:dihydrofolate reductase family protein [Spongiactinospora sp. TRM90649]|uniref:dihydrofolate reductase family protein n=1 Tax=Spongiactinospora sp. TRM90649 TaxID=3031114 RepID=UPI0023F67B44|nr:dihydrofolate reductase family protein [Spongiactinospora sp. TRM90649]MDF5751758.1 dihydrofolate reductase family protein [Spongiactinospora sp. TRM90649]